MTALKVEFTVPMATDVILRLDQLRDAIQKLVEEVFTSGIDVKFTEEGDQTSKS
jgi:hypothetical protein